MLCREVKITGIPMKLSGFRGVSLFWCCYTVEDSPSPCFLMTMDRGSYIVFFCF